MRSFPLKWAAAQIEAAKGTVANDLRDQRELALAKLGRRVDIQVRENTRGAVQVQIDGQLLVGARSIHPLQVETLPDGTIELSLQYESRLLRGIGVQSPSDLTDGEIAMFKSTQEEKKARYERHIDRLLWMIEEATPETPNNE